MLGTEEFMYPALFVGSKLEETGCLVRCHATTRSPIEVSDEEAYPLHARYELRSLYEEQHKSRSGHIPRGAFHSNASPTESNVPVLA